MHFKEKCHISFDPVNFFGDTSNENWFLQAYQAGYTLKVNARLQLTACTIVFEILVE